MVSAALAVLPLLLAAAAAHQQEPAPKPLDSTPPTRSPLVFAPAAEGPGRDLHVVLVAGDEEYRSEESMPQLARILAKVGCTCTVLFALDAASGTIDPTVADHLPGLEVLARADLLVLFVRFRALPDEAMQHFADYVVAGRPIVALRTATHAFAPKPGSRFADWAWNADGGGFGRRVLGETWIAHHGRHGEQGTRGALAPGAAGHPVLRGLDAADVWDPADVYRVRLPLPDGCTPLLLGDVLQTMAKDAPPLPDQGERMPIAWVRERPTQDGRATRVFTTTLGAAQAFTAAGTRRLLVNACLWAAGREAAITKDLDVGLVGDYAPGPFGFGKHRAGIRPADLATPAAPAARAGEAASALDAIEQARLEAFAAADVANLRQLYTWLHMYAQRMGHYPDHGGHKFLLELWVSGVVDHTPENFDRFFVPGLREHDPHYVDLRRKVVNGENPWPTLDAVTSNDTHYAARGAAFQKGMGKANEAWIANDNDGGWSFPDGRIHVLYSSGAVRTLSLQSLQEQYQWPGLDQVFPTWGAESPHADLRKLAN